MALGSVVSKLLPMLGRVRYGQLKLSLPDGGFTTFSGTEPGAAAEIIVHSWDVFSDVLARGDVGLGEGYILGKWTTPDLPAFLTFCAQNADALEGAYHGSLFSRAWFSIMHWVKRNTRSGSSNNIKAHYDVGNRFYQLWLDETMSYSSALFAGQVCSLADAQRAKYNRILKHIGSAPSVLEIGCGWGGFAEMAAPQHDITGLTLSPSQLEFAKERMRNAGLAGRADLRLQDYRDVKGTFDAIVSIEMFEAVGERYWPGYFATLKERLKKGGKAMVQTITIADEEFEGYRKRSDFIRQYTFPGGMLPSIARFKQEATKAGLGCQSLFTFGADYAQTLRLWLEQFDAKREEILALGHSEAFIRSWRFYLSLCIASFTAGRTNVMQVELSHV